jgi:hypothetical protein
MIADICFRAYSIISVIMSIALHRLVAKQLHKSRVQPPTKMVQGVVLSSCLIILGGVTSSYALQPSIDLATAAMRVEQQQQQLRQVQPENFDLSRFPVTDATVKHWRTVLWSTAIVEPQSPIISEAFGEILRLATRPGLSDGQQQTVNMAMQVGTQLYLSQNPIYRSLQNRFQEILEYSRDSEWVALSLSTLQKGGAPATTVRSWSDRIRQRFPQWSENIYLFTTLKDVEQALKPAPLPPLKDLLSWQIAPGQPQLYVICQSERQVLCTSVLKDGNGQFVREAIAAIPGESTPRPQLWSVPLLLDSIHGLGWNFVRGYTPQGIYRIEGTVPQPDLEFFRAYGQFPLVKLFAPREAGVRAFLPNRRGTIPNFQTYQTLLPPSWRNYFPIQQSYWAGKTGRSLFRIHGSGEATDFFKGKQPLPDSQDWNPTIGCLSAIETYDGAGRLVQADMPKIINALSQMGGQNFAGYVIVVEVPGTASTPISLAAIEAALQDGQIPSSIARPQPSLQPHPALEAPSQVTDQPSVSPVDPIQPIPTHPVPALQPRQPLRWPLPPVSQPRQ